MNSHNENGIRLFYFSQGGKSEGGRVFSAERAHILNSQKLPVNKFQIVKLKPLSDGIMRRPQTLRSLNIRPSWGV